MGAVVMLPLEMVHEVVGGESYDFYPLGEHVVSCPEVCRGRPTFKYTRIEASAAVELLGAGHTVAVIAREFGIPEAAVEEAAELAARQLHDWRLAA
jgi:uncharacterized protein (DUF433 family)